MDHVGTCLHSRVFKYFQMTLTTTARRRQHVCLARTLIPLGTAISIPSPTPSSIALSHTTSLTPTHNNSPNYYNNTSPLTPIPNNFDTWPPISPITMCYEPHNLTNSNMNDTYLHVPNNYMMDDLPQNITIMNDTYIHTI